MSTIQERSPKRGGKEQKSKNYINLEKVLSFSKTQSFYRGHVANNVNIKYQQHGNRNMLVVMATTKM